VDPERLRFDFAHHGPIDPVQLREIEHEINELVWSNDPVEIRVVKLNIGVIGPAGRTVIGSTIMMLRGTKTN